VVCARNGLRKSKYALTATQAAESKTIFIAKHAIQQWQGASEMDTKELLIRQEQYWYNIKQKELNLMCKCADVVSIRLCLLWVITLIVWWFK